MSDTCPSCGNPEAEHIWISEDEVALWIPEPGFKKNSCARRPSAYSRDSLPDLVFKVWRPALPCPFCGCRETETIMNDGDVAIECLHCHATGPYVVDGCDDPIEAWNSRYPSVKVSDEETQLAAKQLARDAMGEIEG